jgi:DNA-binding PadR family transcriptional regulator
MKVSLLNLHCLNALTDDSEDISAIVADVRHSTHGDLTASDVATCLNDLITEGMVARSTDAAGNDWFALTTKGRRELEANWVDE